MAERGERERHITSIASRISTSVVYAEAPTPNGPKGAPLLYKTCLETAADSLVEETNSYKLISRLPWTIQAELWALLLKDRQQKKGLETTLPRQHVCTSDDEVFQQLDLNVNFVRDHPEVFGDWEEVYGTEIYSRQHLMWREFGGLLRKLFADSDEASSLAPWRYGYLIENSEHSVMRFSLRSRYALDRQAIDLEQLISSKLVKVRLELLAHLLPELEIKSYDEGVFWWTIGPLRINFEDPVDYKEDNFISFEILNEDDNVECAELLLNAVLSPIEDEHYGGLFCFLTRYLKAFNRYDD